MERQTDRTSRVWTKSVPNMSWVWTFSLTLLSNIHAVAPTDGLGSTGDPPGLFWSSSPPPAPVLFKGSAPNLLAPLPGDQEISAFCRRLRGVFGQRYAATVDCLVPAARPVRVCQNCFSVYGSLTDIYRNISSDQVGPANESCRDVLLRSDRLVLIDLLFTSMRDIWAESSCDNCITKGYQSLTNDTVMFLATLNQTLTCFEKNQQGNETELCKNCKGIYGDLNKLYSKFDKSQALCIDVEDSMNMTRRLWSKSFNCSVPREETVPVIAVSSFMLFLPIIFYLSSFLHSEQKKRKLIHPKRAKSYNSLMNIQDKLR